MGFELRVNLLRALDRIDYRGEIDQEAVTDGFNDCAVKFGDGMLNELVVDLQQAQHAGFVRAHLAAKANDVGEHDRG
jgi:hypothetical protein